VQYENPAKIFGPTGVNDFKFEGFGKESWGIYSTGQDVSMQPNKPADSLFDPFDSNRHSQQVGGVSGGGLGHNLEAAANDTIWGKDVPANPTVVEEKKDGKRGFLYMFGGGKDKKKDNEDEFDKQYDDYLKKRDKQLEIKQPGQQFDINRNAPHQTLTDPNLVSSVDVGLDRGSGIIDTLRK
jgi:hypothetical protein